jgi:hypothetical protein
VAAWLAISLAFLAFYGIVYFLRRRLRRPVPSRVKLVLLAMIIEAETGNELPLGLCDETIERHLYAALKEMDQDAQDLIAVRWAVAVEQFGEEWIMP